MSNLLASLNRAEALVVDNACRSRRRATHDTKRRLVARLNRKALKYQIMYTQLTWCRRY
jgi:hypothetical protein